KNRLCRHHEPRARLWEPDAAAYGLHLRSRIVSEPFPMLIRRRHRRILQVIVLLLALANAAVAQGGTWRCDTGQLCRGHAAGHCCCPPERRPAACDSAVPAACCGMAARSTQQAARSEGESASCCQAVGHGPCSTAHRGHRDPLRGYPVAPLGWRGSRAFDRRAVGGPTPGGAPAVPPARRGTLG